MRKLLLSIASTVVLMSAAVAGPIKGGCRGTYRGKKIEFRGNLREMTNFSSGAGTLHYDNRVIANFEGNDLKVNLLLFSFKMRNDHGEMIDGRATNVSKMKANISRIYVPSYGIDITNLPVSCWRN